MAYSDPENILFSKSIISNKRSNFQLQKNFKELAKTSTPVSEDFIRGFYDDVFLDMPKEGNDSHKKIAEDVDAYINKKFYRRNTNINKSLVSTITEQENKLTLLENPSLLENVAYEDGSILMIGDGSGEDQGMTSRFIIQEGRIREIINDDTYKLIRRALNLPEDNTGIYFVSVNEINKLIETNAGPNIDGPLDLNLKGDALKVDMPDILGLSAYTTLKLTCEGNEIADFINVWDNPYTTTETDTAEEGNQATWMNETDPASINQIQFYLQNSSCKVHYIIDDFYNDSIGPVVEDIVIPAGNTVTIKVLRESDRINNNIPTDIDEYYKPFDNLLSGIKFAGTDVEGYIREWGPTGKYTSVVGAEGRILYEEVYDPFLHGSIPNGLGLPHDDTPYIFNGLPTGETGAWEVNPNVGLIDYDGYSGQEFSAYFTKMIYKQPGLFGSFS